jgi:glutaminyl-tRNA synthetase
VPFFIGKIMNYTMKNFITAHIDNDVKKKVYPELAFRFPPEPNGYLHLGHAKSIILNSLLAKKYNGKLYLRLDDTNPETENHDYVESILSDSKWLALKEFDAVTYTSDYFGKLFEAAVNLIRKDLAYVDFSNDEELKNSRGGFAGGDTATKYRANSIEENLKFFMDMKDGKYKEGTAILRAKINLAHKNMNMRDPVIYRIKHSSHYRTGNNWCIYPMYDFAHPLSDAIEKISHSLCTLEFEDHRILYNWYVDNCMDIFNWKPVEIEFSRLDVENVSLSKRKLLAIVNEKSIGWTDPIMPTISGMRNKGLTPEILIDYILKCGITKVNTVIPEHFFTDSIKSVLKKSDRIYAIVNPVELVFNSDVEGFAKSVMIEKDDVRKTEEPDFWRIYPGNWVRLKNGYNFKATDISDTVVKADIDANSHNLKECEIKPKVAIHWLTDYKKIKARFYSPLFKGDEFNSTAMIEKDILIAPDYLTNHLYEFERIGYFYIDSSHVAHHLAWLKDSLVS